MSFQIDACKHQIYFFADSNGKGFAHKREFAGDQARYDTDLIPPPSLNLNFRAERETLVYEDYWEVTLRIAYDDLFAGKFGAAAPERQETFFNRTTDLGTLI